MRPADELLYDSEATLRLVDDALNELCGPDSAAAEGPRGQGELLQLRDLPARLLRAYAEVTGVLNDLRRRQQRRSTSRDALHDLVAAFERSLALIDGLDVESGAVDAERASKLRSALRHELIGLMDRLHAAEAHPAPAEEVPAGVLADVERRLTALALLLAPDAAHQSAAAGPGEEAPAATD